MPILPLGLLMPVILLLLLLAMERVEHGLDEERARVIDEI